MKKNLKDWREVYYPIAADEATGSDIEAIKHSIRKWKGLEEEVLERFGVELWRRLWYADITDKDNNKLVIDCDSCALCQRYSNSCEDCPLYRSLGGHKCFDEGLYPLLCPEKTFVYDVFLKSGDNKPMVEALEKCLEMVLREDIDEN